MTVGEFDELARLEAASAPEEVPAEARRRLQSAGVSAGGIEALARPPEPGPPAFAANMAGRQRLHTLTH
jgi:hypothetical protein